MDKFYNQVLSPEQVKQKTKLIFRTVLMEQILSNFPEKVYTGLKVVALKTHMDVIEELKNNGWDVLVEPNTSSPEWVVVTITQKKEVSDDKEETCEKSNVVQ